MDRANHGGMMEQKIKFALGDQAFTIIALHAENEALRQKVAELEKATSPEKAPNNGTANSRAKERLNR